MQRLRSIVRIFGKTVGHHRPCKIRQQSANDVIVDTQHRRPIERQAMHELDERTLHALEVVLVSGHMVPVDVGHHRHHGL